MSAEDLVKDIPDPADYGTSKIFYSTDEETGEVYMSDLDIYLTGETGWINSTLDDPYIQSNIESTRGIWGAPYQFLPSADMRVNNDGVSVSESRLSSYGQEYNERIASRMPILLLTPGRPFFLQGFDDNTKKGIDKIIHEAGSDIKESISDLLNGNRTGGKYYTLRFAYAEYYKYVNTMANIMATVLGIGDINVGDAYGATGAGADSSLDSYDWSNFTNDSITGVFSSKEFVSFYLDSETSISDSFSNSTSESMLASAANQVSDIGREIGFLLGTEGDKIDRIIDSETLMNGLDGVNQTLTGIPVVSQLLQDLSSKLVTVMSGGKLLFPEIWNDSSFSRSYSVNLKLRSPEPDVLSWYINIGVPICHLLAFVLPMQTKGATNQGYKSPFLVRGFYKGLFNVDMGIIDSMQFTKGNESSWTLTGLPMEVDVSMNIKELYNAMSMTDNNGATSATIMDNDALLNYLMNICGVNIAEPSIKRYLSLYKTAYKNKFTDIFGNLKNEVEQTISQISHNFNTMNF